MATITPEMKTVIIMLAIIACGAFLFVTTCRFITKLIFILVVFVLLNLTGLINIGQIFDTKLSMDKSIIEVLQDINKEDSSKSDTTTDGTNKPGKYSEYLDWVDNALESGKTSTP